MENLHLFTDFPIVPQPCLPELAASLQAAQANAVRAALGTALPILGVSVPAAATKDVFVATGRRMHGAAVLRGITSGEIMYSRNRPGPETWCISTATEEDAIKNVTVELT